MHRLPDDYGTGLLGGRYRLSAPIGAGGMGLVFEADDERLRRRVAVKLLPPDLQHDAMARSGCAARRPPPDPDMCP